MLDNSCTFGLYVLDSASKLTQIGMARLLTDHVTFAYLTDVFIDESHRGLGLGKWLIRCVREFVEDIPDLRRMVLLSGSKAETARRTYRSELGMTEIDPADGGLVAMAATKEEITSARLRKEEESRT